jgi:hypothetical protein
MSKGLPRSIDRNRRFLEIRSFAPGSPALGATTAVMAAFTDDGKFHRFYNATTLWSRGTAKRITATAGGTAADIKAIQVIVIGTDAAGDPLTESLPVFTVNTAGTVTSVGSFKTITSIEIPAHDGLGATTSVGVYEETVDGVLAAFTDLGVASVIKTATITNPAVPRNITATSGGTAADINNIQAVVVGTNKAGAAISETLPVFTENSGTTVVGNKAFQTVTYIDLPIHDGTAATTAFGTGAKLGLPQKFSRNQVIAAFLANVREGTAPTVAVSASALESNTITLSTALDATAVIVDYYA